MRTCLLNLVSICLGSAIFAACGSNNGLLSSTPLSASGQGAFAVPGDAPEASAHHQSVKHVIVLIQENRSFDDFFATFPGADGARWGFNHTGRKVWLKKSVLAFEDLEHAHYTFQKEYEQGRMNGFDTIQKILGKGIKVDAHNYPYRYVDPVQIQPYWTLAKQYVLADHMFPTQSSGSFTAHQDLIAGGTRVAPGESVIDFPTHGPWGCDAPGGTVTSLITSRGQYLQDQGPFPCFAYPTLRDVLDARNVSWRYFTEALHGAGRAWDAFDAIRVVRYSPEWTDNVINPQTAIFKTIKDGQLPAVSWVIPDAFDSDHPGNHRDSGPSWVAQIVNAVGESSYWKSTVIIVVWDDWGGEFDHVAPPQIDAQGLGFRVPCLIISAYARKGFVSHTQYEFGSILKFIEDNWNLDRLRTSDVRANSIIDAFDFNQKPRKFVPIDSKYSKQYFLSRPPSGLPVDSE